MSVMWYAAARSRPLPSGEIVPHASLPFKKRAGLYHPDMQTSIEGAQSLLGSDPINIASLARIQQLELGSFSQLLGIENVRLI